MTASHSSSQSVDPDGRPAALMARIQALEAQLAQLTSQGAMPADTADSQCLRQSEERFRQLAEQSTDMISCHTSDGRYLYVSPACRQILGLEPSQIVGRSAYDFILPADRPIVQKAHDKQLRTGKPNAVTYRMRHAQGHGVWVESTTRCLLDEQDRIREIHSASRDITERMTTQQALAQSEEHYRSLVEGVRDIIMRLDAQYRILFVNSAANLDGRQSLLGQSFFTRLMPEHHSQARQLLQKVFEQQEPGSASFCVMRSDGQVGWYVFRFAPIQENGRTVAATVIATDISRRKEAEEALLLIRAAVENVQDAVVITSPDLTAPGPYIVYVNPAFEKMTGYSAQEVMGQTPRILQGKRTSRALLDQMRRTLQQGQVFHGETRNYRKDGSEYVLEWNVSPVRDAQGKVINYVSIQRDVTERRRQEEAMGHHQAELAHVGRLSTMGEMASGLAHELNQPLSAISNYARGCLRRLQVSPHPDPKIAQAIEAAATQADRAGQIIRRLRQFMRKRVPQHMPVSVNNVVHDAVTLVAGPSRQHQIDLRLDLAPNIPMVKADHVQIEQVVLNLMRNAIEAVAHLPVPRRQVTIFTRLSQEGVRLSVLDAGQGMDEATRLRLFEPFFTTKHRGLGMGLPICLSIIESHNGRLWAADGQEPDLLLGVSTAGGRQEADSSASPHGPVAVGGLLHFWLPAISPDDLANFTESDLDATDYIPLEGAD